ncbi:hypothetical protein EV200_103401 [Pedobacter psychrotolerans]|uniref:HNH endonuclease n=1 Tax=Pedobacter psychrotolerans TaxID=1843235 RepID=A0A4R2HG55_9SPHI|nr:hypothetical protein [Pedobacter psychrotolerans]TCO27067.1 hypothetical protein EV200_103401 [Pedobacter psychrotolerans]GGE58645.1 hypothetical protein GCM10011413_26410 [Pedobacter psychrotolerans]
MISLIIDHSKAIEHYNTITNEVQKAIRKVIFNHGITALKKRPAKILEDDLKAYLQYLLRKDHLINLITAMPEDLERTIKEVITAVPSLLVSTSTSSSILYYIFIDNIYLNKFDKFEFVKQINVDTCVYCNRNYIYYLTKAEKVKPQIDHFYPKKKYPYLGMSFYNLIPSCQTCNGPECKSDLDPLSAGARLINPHLIKNGDFKFNYGINSIDYSNSFNKDAFSVIVEKHPKKHLEVFKLEGLYNKHTDHIADLVVKASLKYSPEYREYLKYEYRRLELTDHDINKLIVGNYTDEHELHRRPLSKLYLDIASELNLINN